MPEMLPWCEPALSSFGGGWACPEGSLNKEAGWCSTPHAGNYNKKLQEQQSSSAFPAGAQVFVFFEAGDVNKPVYFAVAQSGQSDQPSGEPNGDGINELGAGWFSEHPNQHVFKSDNVRIRIDEKPTDSRSSTKFDTYTDQQSIVAKTKLVDKSNLYQKDDTLGVIKNVNTRIDIEILAEDMNAVNLQIHGNVNMKVIGDIYKHHQGDLYETHIGNTFIRHKGSTYVEREGDEIWKQWGNLNNYREGNIDDTTAGNRKHTIIGTFTHDIHRNYECVFRNNVTSLINGTYTSIVAKDVTLDYRMNADVKVAEKLRETVGDDKTVTVKGSYNNTTEYNYTCISNQGNIDIATLGQFEIFTDDSYRNISEQGYWNIGTKGNVSIRSTFGNIGLHCVKNDQLADFEEDTIVIPWNPSFLNDIAANPLLNLTFDRSKTLVGFECPDISSAENLLKFIANLPNFLVYDGLPVTFPVKMITQNPNIKAPNGDEWLALFRSEPASWDTITNNEYWKVPGKLMGNIDLKTWSGDITLSTTGDLGCAGNITLNATNKHGTLPGYKAGCVTINNSTPDRIFADPRDLFMDSEFTARLTGKFNSFQHGIDKGFDLLPPTASNTLAGFGIEMKFVHGKYENAVLGCPGCIADYFYGLPLISDVAYITDTASMTRNDWPGAVWHKYGWAKSERDQDPKYGNTLAHRTRGVFNVGSVIFDGADFYEDICHGDGHAIEKGFCDANFNSVNLGAFVVNSSGERRLTIGRNSYITYQNKDSKYKYTENYVVNRDYMDDTLPLALDTYYVATEATAFASVLGDYGKPLGENLSMVEAVKPQSWSLSPTVHNASLVVKFGEYNNSAKCLNSWTKTSKKTVNGKIATELTDPKDTITIAHNYERSYAISNGIVKDSHSENHSEQTIVNISPAGMKADASRKTEFNKISSHTDHSLKDNYIENQVFSASKLPTVAYTVNTTKTVNNAYNSWKLTKTDSSDFTREKIVNKPAEPDPKITDYDTLTITNNGYSEDLVSISTTYKADSNIIDTTYTGHINDEKINYNAVPLRASDTENAQISAYLNAYEINLSMPEENAEGILKGDYEHECRNIMKYNLIGAHTTVTDHVANEYTVHINGGSSNIANIQVKNGVNNSFNAFVGNDEYNEHSINTLSHDVKNGVSNTFITTVSNAVISENTLNNVSFNIGNAIGNTFSTTISNDALQDGTSNSIIRTLANASVNSINNNVATAVTEELKTIQTSDGVIGTSVLNASTSISENSTAITEHATASITNIADASQVIDTPTVTFTERCANWVSNAINWVMVSLNMKKKQQ